MFRKFVKGNWGDSANRPVIRAFVAYFCVFRGRSF